jgi:hypothetical protein
MFETRINPDPIVGNWYRRLDNYDEFVVVAIDEDSGNIEVQFFNGDVTEITPDEWEAFDLEVIAEPEDWSGALEPVDDSEESEPSSMQPLRAEYEEEDLLRMEDEAERETRPTDEM